jgi:hypothetical protein
MVAKLVKIVLPWLVSALILLTIVTVVFDPQPAQAG